ncbi:hypothetical protein ACQKNN_27305 [Bacillus paramycoides]|uniref:hypothetical protein n=1 Tax=Bacillus paramycoides TaxID=2026194 RepID=UPI003D04CE41
MADKMQLECMDNQCRTVMFGHFLEGIRCVNCGGPVLPKPYNPVKKQTDRNNNREIRTVANDCAIALCKKVINELTNKEEPLLQIVQSNINSVPVVFYKGKEINGKIRVSFDWKTNEHHHKPGTYVHIEHLEDSEKHINTMVIQHNQPITDKE